jgi:hypothetical protein
MVKQKSGLNRSILDQGWGEFRRQLAYKVVWHGGMLLAVPPHHTSQTCPCCGHVSKDNRQTQASSCASIAVTKITPMWSARSIFCRRDAIPDEGQDKADASSEALKCSPDSL